MGLSYYSISDLTLTEGESGIITVYRTGDTSYGADIDVATADSTAVQYRDYTGWYGKYRFDPGMSNVTIRLSTIEDALVEGTETLSIKLTNNDVSSVITKGTSTVTINDNDFSPSRYTLSPVYLAEGESKNLTLTREGYTGRAETVILETSNGTAISGVDYEAFGREITFGAGETTKYMTVTSYDDKIVESTESFSVSLKSKATRAELALTTVTIADNDVLAPAPVVIAPKPVVIAPTQTVNSNNPVTTTNSNNPVTTTNSNNPVTTTVTANSNNQLNSNNTYNITNNYTTNVNSGNTSTANSNSGNTLTNTNSGNTTTTTNTNSNNTTMTTNTNWTLMRVDNSVKTGDIVSQFFKDSPITSIQTQDITETKILDVVTNTWSDKVQVNRVSRATDKGDTLEALAPDSAVTTPTGSVLAGGKGADVIMGKSGWDNLEGGEGDDLIHGGNGRDILTGGSGRDELWGDFGWNTFKSEKDGFSDLIVVKSDQWVFNWL
jgi:Ca2+-binding RTX toxin-like protein